MKRESREVTVSYNPNVFSSPDELEEDSLYENAAVCAVVEKTATSEKKILSIMKPFAPVAVCWVALVIIMALRIHFTSVISAKLSDEVKASDDIYQKLTDAIAEKEIWMQSHRNLEVQIDTLRQTNSVLENNITNLTEENQQMKQENQTLWAAMEQMKQENQLLKTEMKQMKQENQTLWAAMEQMKQENQLLKTKMKQIREEINQMKAESQTPTGKYMTRPYGPTVTPYWNRYTTIPVHRITPYYIRRYKRHTEPCQAGWLHFQSKCYLICSRDSPDQKTWQAAQDDCREKDADLVAIQSPAEQDFIYSSSAAGFGVDGFWISLRVEDGSWKWLNGSHLTENYWMQPPADNQNCTITVKDTRGWRAESCDVRKEWVCQKDALQTENVTATSVAITDAM